MGHENEPVLLGVGGPLRQSLALLPRGQQRGSIVLGAGDVGLIERIDPERHPCRRRRELPAEKFRTHFEWLSERDADHGVARILERIERRLGRAVSL